MGVVVDEAVRSCTPRAAASGRRSCSTFVWP